MPVAGSGGSFLEPHELGQAQTLSESVMSNPRCGSCCSPSCSVPGAGSPPARLSPHRAGGAPEGTRIGCGIQPEPQKQGMSKSMGSGRVFSSERGRCTWEAGARRKRGWGDDRLRRRGMRRWAPHEPFPGSSLSSPQEHGTAPLFTARDELPYPNKNTSLSEL